MEEDILYHLVSILGFCHPIARIMAICADTACVLLPPHSVEVIPTITKDRITVALATRYGIRKAVAKHHVPQHIDQWGKIRRIDGGDTMIAALLGRASLDRRDATHVHVSRDWLFRCA